MTRAEMQGAGKPGEEIDVKIKALEEAERQKVLQLANSYISASVGELKSIKKTTKALAQVVPGAAQVASLDPEDEDLDEADEALDADETVDLAEVEATASDDSDEVGFDPEAVAEQAPEIDDDQAP